MYCLLNWSSPDFCDLSITYNEDGSPQIFERRNEAEEEIEHLNGEVRIVELR